MLQHSFESVREQLLRAGIAPRHVSRYVTELREHMTDLVARERAAGMDAREAEAKARTILGTDAQLTQAMLDRSPPRAWAAKAPWLVFGIGPVVAIIALVWLVSFGIMFNLLMPLRTLQPSQLPAEIKMAIIAAVIFSAYMVGPLLSAGAITIALRQRLSSGWVWAGLAIIALFSGFFGFHAPMNDGDGPYRATQLADSFAGTLAWVGLRAAVLFGLSALAYRMLKQRTEAAA